MKRNMLFVILLLVVFGTANGQGKEEKFTCRQWPMRAADVTLTQSDEGKMSQPSALISSATDAQVFALNGGVVSSVFTVPDDHNETTTFAVVEHSRDSFFVYSHIADLTIKKGDPIEAGQAIAKAQLRRGSGKNEVEVQIWVKGQSSPSPSPLKAAYVAAFIKNLKGNL